MIMIRNFQDIARKEQVMRLILSIHDKHLQNIINGSKTIELRKTFPKNTSPTSEFEIYFYNTKTKKIEAKINTRYKAVPKVNIYLGLIGLHSKVSFEEIIAYFSNSKEYTYYYFTSNICLLDMPLPKERKAPQSWCYYETIFENNN